MKHRCREIGIVFSGTNLLDSLHDQSINVDLVKRQLKMFIVEVPLNLVH